MFNKKKKNSKKDPHSLLLSLKLQNNVDRLKSSVPRPAPGIPLNSLPGWDEVPLYLKLPMLDCPGSQIVFTRSKIGNSLLKFQSDYDPSFSNEVNVYNPLHDPNLKSFYSRKRNLNLLKKIGKITEDNYVICDLKEFNSYRRMLNRFHLFSIYKELYRREQEHSDHTKILHAETIAEQERKKFQNAQDNLRDPSDIKRNKLESIKSHHKRCVANIQNINNRTERIVKLNNLKQIIMEQKKFLHNTAIEQRQIVANDILRNRMIAVKKRIKIENDRSLAHSKHLLESKEKKKLDKSMKRWHLVLAERFKKHHENKLLVEMSDEKFKLNMAARQIKCQKQWREIAQSIAHKSEQSHKQKANLAGRVVKKLIRNFKCSISQGPSVSAKLSLPKTFNLYRLNHVDIRDAVNTAIDIEEHLINETKTQYGDYIYEAAKYIIEHVLKTVRRDFSADEQLMKSLVVRIDQTFDYIKSGIITKVAHVLTQLDDEIKGKPSASQTKLDVKKSFVQLAGPFESLEKFVKFNRDTPIIGVSSWEKDDLATSSLQKLKSVHSRSPTPAGSLTSLVAVLNAGDSGDAFKRDYQNTIDLAKKDEQIFIEHFLVKFKRLLLIGVGKKVFEAISYYKIGTTYSINKELLNVDRKYLVSTMAKSILTYAINCYDFKANLRLCISALSSDIIVELQNSFMKLRDPKHMKFPRSRCRCGDQITNC